MTAGRREFQVAVEPQKTGESPFLGDEAGQGRGF